MGNNQDLLDQFPKDLSLLYEHYVSEVSNRVMAASIELSRFVHAFCCVARPLRIADFGSGFSSVVLRHYRKHCDPDACVWSVDDSDKWLNETRKYLDSHNLPSDNMLTWKVMKEEGASSLDFILYDLGHVRELRKDALDDALNMVAKGGVIILDDMNFIGYKRHAKHVLKEHNFEAYNLRGFTHDSLGRYSYLLVKPNLGESASAPK